MNYPTTWPNGKLRSSGNAFDILYQPRAEPGQYRTPQKPGPKLSKLQQSVLAMMTEGERNTARILRDNSKLSINVANPSLADKAKTARLVGRSNSARSQ